MKKIVVFVVLFIGLLYSKSLEQIYLEDGIEAVKKILDENIKKSNFWIDTIKDIDVKYGYYDNNTTIITVDKVDKKMSMYTYEDGNLTNIFHQDIITGELGDKFKEGDLKTPVGAYEVTRRFTPPSDYYGPIAFSLSYPNLYDKILGKTGSGIWIHGFPSDGNRKNELTTEGCVALKNDLLLEFDELMQKQTSRAIALISESGEAKASKDDIAILLRDIFFWKQAWTISDIDKYLNFYDDSFVRYDGMKFDDFKVMKKRIFDKKESKKIVFSDYEISPYPNSQGKKIFRIAFMEHYEAPSHKFQGQKTLYAMIKDGKMKIILEQ